MRTDIVSNHRYSLVTDPIPTEIVRDQSQMNQLRATIQRIMRDCGLLVDMTYVQYKEKSIALCFSLNDRGDLYSDKSTVAIRMSIFKIKEDIGKDVSIAIDDCDGTVWITL